jgi:tetratricopeptide (TPR) repeat protein
MPNPFMTSSSAEMKLKAELEGWTVEITSRIDKALGILLTRFQELTYEDPKTFPLHLFKEAQILTCGEDILETGKSIESLKEFYGLSLTLFSTLYNVAHDLMRHERIADAREAYFYLCLIEPSEPRLWLDYGNAEYHTGNFSQAEKAYQKAIDLDPGEPRGYFFIAHALEELHLPKEALGYINQAITLIKSKSDLTKAWLEPALNYKQSLEGALL